MKAFKYIMAGAAIAVAAVSGVTLTSCSDLDEHPYSFIDPSAYYKTESDVQTALTGTYNRFRRIYTANNQFYVATLELLTEQGWPTYNKNDMELINKWSNANNASSTISNNMNYAWTSAYETVNRANIVIARADEVTYSDASTKDYIKGQAYFLRGYAMFHLLRIYGGVPYPTTYTNGVSGLEVPRLSLDETYAQVIADLEQAESMLPQRGTSGYDTWRVAKGAAQAALGEVYLYRATMNNNNTEDLTKSRDWSKKVIDSGVYSLNSNFTDQFYWFKEDASKNTAESLFELQFAPESGQDNGMHIRFGVGRTNAGYFGCYQYARMGVSAFLYKEMVDNGDKRAEAILSYFEGLCGDDVKDQISQPTTYNVNTFCWEPKAWNDRSVEHNAVFNCKYFDRKHDNTLQHPCANFPIIRYSEVLLNYAEAANLLQAGSGVAQLNQVRNRAGLANTSASSQADIDEDIFQQRRYEFVGEAKIFWDELRKDRLAEYATAKCKEGTAKGMSYFDGEILFKAKKTFLFKIAQSTIDSNSMLEQNPDNESK